MKPLGDLPPRRVFPDTALSSRIQIIERHIARSERPRPGRRRSRQLAVVGFAVALCATATAAAVYTAWAPATLPNEVRCYAVASLEFGDNFPGTTTIQSENATTGEIDLVLSAVEQCASLWRQGFVVEGVGTQPVPNLVACVLPEGAAAVFPGEDDTCRQLGLPRLS
jgi:hypothetical protein